jgi:hypothetical protein
MMIASTIPITLPAMTKRELRGSSGSGIFSEEGMRSGLDLLRRLPLRPLRSPSVPNIGRISQAHQEPIETFNM